MPRVSGKRRDEMLALYEWIQTQYARCTPFVPDQAHRRAFIESAQPFEKWSVERFTEYCELLKEHRYLVSVVSPSGSVTYSIPQVTEKRNGAKDALPLAIEAIKSATTDKPATIKEIEASGHKSQMIRTAIDILLAVGIVKSTVGRPIIEIEWDSEQEALLKKPKETTAEYLRLLDEVKALDREIQQINDQIAGRTAPVVLPPSEPAPMLRDSSEIQ
jgi:hypothetical protein